MRLWFSVRSLGSGRSCRILEANTQSSSQTMLSAKDHLGRRPSGPTEAGNFEMFSKAENRIGPGRRDSSLRNGKDGHVQGSLDISLRFKAVALFMIPSYRC